MQLTAPEADENNHNIRLKEILENIGYANKQPKVRKGDKYNFSCLLPLDAEEPIFEIPPDAIEQIPDKDKRKSIIHINNFFLEIGSQNLGLDIQYIDGKYQESRGLDYTLDQLINTTINQPNYFFQNLAFLEKAHNTGVVKIPIYLLDFAKKNQVDKFCCCSLTEKDKVAQEVEFKKFYHLHSNNV